MAACIAGMTDRYAIEFYSRLNGASGLTIFISRSATLAEEHGKK
jgi:hypothetical protein